MEMEAPKLKPGMECGFFYLVFKHSWTLRTLYVHYGDPNLVVQQNSPGWIQDLYNICDMNIRGTWFNQWVIASSKYGLSSMYGVHPIAVVP